MRSTAVLLAISCVCALAMVPAVYAQEAGDTETEVHVLEEEYIPPGGYSLSGSEVPFYYCVKTFFRMSYAILGGQSSSWDRLLKDTGIQSGSASEAELRTAILVAAAVWSDKPDIPKGLAQEDEELYSDLQTEWRLDKRQKIAPIYRGLRDVIREEYGTTDRFDAYLEEKIRPGVGLASDEPCHPVEEMLDAEFNELAGVGGQ